ncbi:hypothetical protein AVI51_07165 [Piscirickettsia salmonis]|uniref:Uncharacterized protein n=1 Tax=Piscirickettsia salmonis TaxID=1238 RepID=A0A9Q5VFB0_PISSA|nr:hypothetical protein [Piscirickettsia salmonis]ALA25853.1 oligoribonuclease [Piscirickettsia salmonis]APS43330.1 hypothetical protein AVI48_02360 [Piscirickettsia salmonis]APS46679.1 hypothetical protein AVI49_02965 [Piscirickettsia salmonis]APS50655.1 hypothetical protein AVI50_07250 [Piscirickettsia salmonis]APS53860.1 hypothetical protein AVI51_07165 [Piscirickettsia salmonis]
MLKKLAFSLLCSLPIITSAQSVQFSLDAGTTLYAAQLAADDSTVVKSGDSPITANIPSSSQSGTCNIDGTSYSGHNVIVLRCRNNVNPACEYEALFVSNNVTSIELLNETYGDNTSTYAKCDGGSCINSNNYAAECQFDSK